MLTTRFLTRQDADPFECSYLSILNPRIASWKARRAYFLDLPALTHEGSQSDLELPHDIRPRSVATMFRSLQALFFALPLSFLLPSSPPPIHAHFERNPAASLPPLMQRHILTYSESILFLLRNSPCHPFFLLVPSLPCRSFELVRLGFFSAISDPWISAAPPRIFFLPLLLLHSRI